MKLVNPAARRIGLRLQAVLMNGLYGDGNEKRFTNAIGVRSNKSSDRCCTDHHDV